MRKNIAAQIRHLYSQKHSTYSEDQELMYDNLLYLTKLILQFINFNKLKKKDDLSNNLLLKLAEMLQNHDKQEILGDFYGFISKLKKLTK